jgi:hypothetical protein
LIETLPEKPMINPTERTLDGSNTIRLRRLRFILEHVHLQEGYLQSKAPKSGPDGCCISAPPAHLIARKARPAPIRMPTPGE